MLAAEYQTLAPPMREAVVKFFDLNEARLAADPDPRPSLWHGTTQRIAARRRPRHREWTGRGDADVTPLRRRTAVPDRRRRHPRRGNPARWCLRRLSPATPRSRRVCLLDPRPTPTGTASVQPSSGAGIFHLIDGPGAVGCVGWIQSSRAAGPALCEKPTTGVTLWAGWTTASSSCLKARNALLARRASSQLR